MLSTSWLLCLGGGLFAMALEKEDGQSSVKDITLLQRKVVLSAGVDADCNFGTFDRNGDGVVDQEEMNATNTAWEQTLRYLDANRDGSLSQDEFPGPCDMLEAPPALNEMVAVNSHSGKKSTESFQYWRPALNEMVAVNSHSGKKSTESFQYWRVLNGKYTGWRPSVTEVNFYSDLNCSVLLPDATIVCSGEGGGACANAMDNDPSTSWRPQCGQCDKHVAWIGVKFLQPQVVRCAVATGLGNGAGGGVTWNGGVKLEGSTDGNQWQDVGAAKEGSDTALNADEEILAEIVLKAAMRELATMLGAEFCWRETYDRGVGQPANCKSGWEQRGAMCYAQCPHNYHRRDGDIEFCNELCGASATDTGLLCRTNGWTQVKPWCSGGCPSGYTDTGCFCEPSSYARGRFYSPGKTKFDGGVVACTNPSYPQMKHTGLTAYYCYPAPRPGFDCQLTACQSMCPSFMVSCGIGACALSSGMCIGTIVDMSISVVSAAASTALIVMSAGAAAPGLAALSKSADSFKKAAIGGLKGFKDLLLSGTVRTTIIKKVKDAVQKEVIEAALKKAVKDNAQAVSETAIGIIMEEFVKKDETNMDGFDFTSLDITGFSGAVKSSVEGETDLQQAAAWVGFLGTFDPTGWVGAAAAFMKPMCKDYH